MWLAYQVQGLQEDEWIKDPISQNKSTTELTELKDLICHQASSQQIYQTPGALISNGARQIFSLKSIHHLRPAS